MNIPTTMAMNPAHWRQVSRPSADVTARPGATSPRRRRTGQAAGPAPARIDARRHRQAGAQPGRRIGLGGVQRHLHRYALHHTREVAGGVLRRQQAEQSAGSRGQAVHAALNGMRRVDVGGQPHLHPRPHLRKLGLLEIGGDIQTPGRRRHRDELRAGLHVLSELGSPVADDTIERGTDHRVGQVVRGQLFGRGRVLLACLSLAKLRGIHCKLLLGGGFLRLGGGQRRVGLAPVGDGLIVRLVRRPPRLGQLRRPRRVRPGEGLLRLRLHDRRLSCLDHRLLLGHLARRRQHRGGGFGGGRPGLIQPRLPVGRVEQDQRIAGMDGLVVGDGDADHVALDARSEHGDVALYIGVVGGLDVAALGEPPVGGHCDRGCHDNGQGWPHQPAKAPAPGRAALCGQVWGQIWGQLAGNGVHRDPSELNGSVREWIWQDGEAGQVKTEPSSSGLS